MIWIALLIPVAAIFVCSKYFARSMHYGEYAVLFMVPLLCIVIGKGCSVSSQTKDSETWNNYGTRAEYFEDWNERVSCKHPQYSTSTDSKGNTTRTYTGDAHSYDVNYHSEYWQLKDNSGSSRRIKRSKFEEICKLWKMKKFADLSRRYHNNDGDKYYSDYTKIFEDTVPVTTQHTYKNKIQASKSVFNFDEVMPDTIKQYKLVGYPTQTTFDYNPIIGWSDWKASEYLQKQNSLVGSRRQLHMLLLVFIDQPYTAAAYQEAYWKGGNKNEFIVCVGVDKQKNIKWTKVISWTTAETLKVVTESKIKEMKTFDCMAVVKYMADTIPKSFRRREFAEFDYLTVQPTMKAVIWTFVVTLLVTIGISIFSVMNNLDFNESVRQRFSHRRRRRR